MADAIVPAPFIVGMPRSGTTLLRIILDSHPTLAIPSETVFIPAALRQYAGHNLTRERFYTLLAECPWWGDFHLDNAEFRARLNRVEPFSVSDGIRCFYQTYAERFGKARWGDKTPAYNLCMSTIDRFLPEAHFIHLIRDGRDVALSNNARGAALIVEHAANWRDSILETRRQSRICKHYIEVRYEDLVGDTTNEIKRICRFLGLKFDPLMELYYLRAGSRLAEWGDLRMRDGTMMCGVRGRLEGHRLLLRSPDRSRICRWKIDLTKQEVISYQLAAGPLLRDYGYELMDVI